MSIYNLNSFNPKNHLMQETTIQTDKPKEGLEGNEFGICDTGKIEIDEASTKLKFTRDKDDQGNELVTMHLSLTFKKDDSVIAFGPKRKGEVPFSPYGAFEFNTEDPTLDKKGFLFPLTLFIEPNPDPTTGKRGVRLFGTTADNRKFFDLKTAGDKRENGGFKSSAEQTNPD